MFSTLSWNIRKAYIVPPVSFNNPQHSPSHKKPYRHANHHSTLCPRQYGNQKWRVTEDNKLFPLTCQWRCVYNRYGAQPVSGTHVVSPERTFGKSLTNQHIRTDMQRHAVTHTHIYIYESQYDDWFEKWMKLPHSASSFLSSRRGTLMSWYMWDDHIYILSTC